MPRSVYPMALDAAPQDGRWMEDPATVAKVVKFLVSKLPPDQLAELDGHLTDNTEPQATDHRLPEGNIKENWLDYTPRNRRAMADSLLSAPRRGAPLTVDQMRRADPEAAKSFDDRFGPNATRLTR